jgi:hypothetical protein
MVHGGPLAAKQRKWPAPERSDALLVFRLNKPFRVEFAACAVIGDKDQGRIALTLALMMDLKHLNQAVLLNVFSSEE